MLTLGLGSAPDTIYVADNKAGAVVKYGLIAGTWTQEGAVEVPFVTGVTANDVNGVVTIYATSAGEKSREGTLYKISDVSGLNGVLSGDPRRNRDGSRQRGLPRRRLRPRHDDRLRWHAARGADDRRLGKNPRGGDRRPDEQVAFDNGGRLLLRPSELQVTVHSTDQAVAPVERHHCQRERAPAARCPIVPAAAGTSKLTVTVEAPDGSFASTQVNYGASAYQGDPSDRYYAGAGNASTAIDVGGGYMILGDDESNVLRLYHARDSSEPVKTWDFTSQLPFGTTEMDIEAAARSGNTLYWMGSLSNKHNGEPQPGRNVVFAATITGSGAGTEISYVGSYTHLREDLIEWDDANGKPLGLAQSAEAGVPSDIPNGFNVEGLEFAAGSPSTAYVAFRAPLEPPGESRHDRTAHPGHELLLAGHQRQPRLGESDLRRATGMESRRPRASARSARTRTTNTSSSPAARTSPTRASTSTAGTANRKTNRCC